MTFSFSPSFSVACYALPLFSFCLSLTCLLLSMIPIYTKFGKTFIHKEEGGVQRQGNGI